MKFVAVAALVATIKAEYIDCTDEDDPTPCADDACCGYLSPPEGDVRRVCSDIFQTVPDGGEEGDVYSCEAPSDDSMEGASKVALGASALLAALYMA